MNPLSHLYYKNLSQKLELELESLESLHENVVTNLLGRVFGKPPANSGPAIVHAPKKSYIKSR